MINWTSPQTRLAFKEIESYAQIYGRGSRIVRAAYAYRKLRNWVYYSLQQRWAGVWNRPCLNPSKLHILLHLRGGLGDCAAHRVCILALRKVLPNAVFYYYTDSPYAARLLIEADGKNVCLPPGKMPYRRAFDMACELCLSFKTVHVRKQRIAQLAPAFLPILETSLQRQAELRFFLSDNYLLDDALGRFLYQEHASRLEAIRYLSALDFDVQQTGELPPALLKRDINRYQLPKYYITVHSGINATFQFKGAPLKCWPVEKWREFTTLFKKQFPHIQIVQLGGKNSPIFDFVDKSLVGETPVEDLPAILNNALAHVDGESGLVQLTRWLKTRAVVLFGPTAPCLFALSKNKSLETKQCGYCMWLSGPSWHTTCALGHARCQNMEMDARAVLNAVSEILQTTRG